MSPEQLAKLPKWAQEEFKTLERERDIAVRELNQWVDNQTPSNIKIHEHVPIGPGGPKRMTRFIQGYCVEFEHAGVWVEVTLPYWDAREKYITLKWGKEQIACDEVAFIPYSHQSARIVAKENMR